MPVGMHSATGSVSAMTPVQTSDVSMYQPNARSDKGRSYVDEV
jgi:hypothetical protein